MLPCLHHIHHQEPVLNQLTPNSQLAMASVTSAVSASSAPSALLGSKLQPASAFGLGQQPRVGFRSSRRDFVVSSCASSSSSSSREEEKWAVSRRDLVNVCLSAIPVGLFARPALALLEADDDEGLLEKVKEDRKKRIEKRGAVISLKEETDSIQKAVYELSKAGQAIDGGDFTLASNVLGTGDEAWIKDAEDAFSKVNKSAESEGEAATFISSIKDLQSAVKTKDPTSSKNAFVASASALSKWSITSGLLDQIKGL